MSDLGASRQASASDRARSILTSPRKLAVCAAGCMFLFLFVPAIYVSTSIAGVNVGKSVSGIELAAGMAWIAFFVFAAGAAARFVPALFTYQKILDAGAFVMVAVTILYASFFGPLASALGQVQAMQGQLSGLGGPPAPAMHLAIPEVSLRVIPHVGVVLFILAPIALLLVRRRERAIA